jgi:hypothetical protein
LQRQQMYSSIWTKHSTFHFFLVFQKILFKIRLNFQKNSSKTILKMGLLFNKYQWAVCVRWRVPCPLLTGWCLPPSLCLVWIEFPEFYFFREKKLFCIEKIKPKKFFCDYLTKKDVFEDFSLFFLLFYWIFSKVEKKNEFIRKIDCVLNCSENFWGLSFGKYLVFSEWKVYFFVKKWKLPFFAQDFGQINHP